MSTKIFDAYRMPSSVPVLPFVRDLAARMEHARWLRTQVALVMVAAAVEASTSWREVADLIAPFGGVTAQMLSSRQLLSSGASLARVAADILDVVDDYTRAGTVRLAAGVDTSCSVVFLDDPGDPGWTYVKVFSESSRLRDAVVAGTPLVDFSYWNNSDGPDDVTDAEWEERRVAWDRVLPGWTAPARVGATWESDANRMLVLSVRNNEWLSPDAVAQAVSDDDPDKAAKTAAWLVQPAPAWACRPAPHEGQP